MSSLWGDSWDGLQVATEALGVLQELLEEARKSRTVSAWQCRAVEFADLATKLWVANQVILSGTGAVNQGSASQKRLALVKTFVLRTSVEICHQASELLRELGLTDARLLTNYAEALQLGAAANSPSARL